MFLNHHPACSVGCMREQGVTGPLLAVLLVGVVLTGCLGDDDVGGGDAAFTEDTGSLTGSVFDENLNPLDDATVMLVATDAAEGDARVFNGSTDGQGSYSVKQVPPGPYRAQVSSFCCHEAVEQVEIVAAEAIPMDFMLALKSQAERQDPWVDGAHDWTGLFECVVGTINVCQENDRRHGEVVEPGAKTITVALDWEPNAVLGAQELNLRVVNGGNDRVMVEGTGGPGMQLVATGELLEDLESETWTIVFDVQAAGTDVLWSQQFTIWWSVHYWDAAPSGYSTLPDQ